MRIFTYKKQSCFQISNETDIFINETITKWQSKLKLKSCISWTNNFDFYDKMHRLFLKKPEQKGKVAACMSGINLMYISKMAHQLSSKELETSIVHELLHMRYPSKSEIWVVKKTKVVLK